MKIVYIILAILGLLLAIIVGGAMLYAIIVFRHEHRWAKMKSDKYDMYNMYNMYNEEAETCERTRQ